VKRSSILVALDAAGAKIDDIIQDAVKRDRALEQLRAGARKSRGEVESAEDRRRTARSNPR